MKKVSPALVGAFVIGAFALGVLAMLFFGSVNFLRHQQRFVVYFNESIQGLNLGSSVKLKGVAVGKVVDLHILYDNAKGNSVIEVTCEFDRNMIQDESGKGVNVSDPRVLKTFVDHGLRAQLGVVGLATGLLVVELDFYDPSLYPIEESHYGASKYPIVPPVPSTISEFQASATEILTKIKHVDFEGIGINLKGLLVEARAQVKGIDLKALTTQWQKTGAAYEDLAKSPELKDAITNLNKTLVAMQGSLVQLNKTLATVDKQADTNGESLQVALKRTQEAMKQFSATALTIKQFIDTQQNLGADSHRALTQLSEAAESVQRLADYLERNPSAILSGRATTKP